MPNFDVIKQQVEAEGGVLTVTMGTLRDAYGAGGLGLHVSGAISRQLAGVGLGHVPRELPTYQDQQVRIYKLGTPVGDLIDPVLMPGPQNDANLIAQCGEGATDYASIVQKIRELVLTE